MCPVSCDFEMAFRECGRTLGFGLEPYGEGHLLVMVWMLFAVWSPVGYDVDVICGLVT